MPAARKHKIAARYRCSRAQMAVDTPYSVQMREPSQYETKAWQDLIRQQKRPTRRAARWVETTAGDAAAGVAEGARTVRERVPAIDRGMDAVKRGGQSAARAIPDSAKETTADWARSATDATAKTIARVSRIGLSPERVVARDRKSVV